MWYDLHGTGEPRLDAAFDLVAEHIAGHFWREHEEPLEGHVSPILPAPIAFDSPLRRKGECVI